MQEVSRSYDQADENARRVIRGSRKATRRRYTPEEKVRIVIEVCTSSKQVGQNGRL